MNLLRKRNFFWVGASLVFAAILVSFSFVGHDQITVNTSSSNLDLVAMTQEGHPMVPVPTSSGITNGPASTVASLGCSLPLAQCTASLNWGGYAVCLPQGLLEAGDFRFVSRAR